MKKALWLKNNKRSDNYLFIVTCLIENTFSRFDKIAAKVANSSSSKSSILLTVNPPWINLLAIFLKRWDHIVYLMMCVGRGGGEGGFWEEFLSQSGQ